MRVLVAGALGEVGRTVCAALAEDGHDIVRVSSRAPMAGAPEVVSLEASATMVDSVDLVVNCSGRGDRRQGERTGLDAAEVLAPAAARAGLPSVLISTTRVLEGYDGDPDEDAPPRPTTPYAMSNAANEEQWLDHGGQSVLRITNFFAPPASLASPQALLLPWSLVTEALATGHIGIRSGPDLRKEFVSAADVAAATLLLAVSADAPRVVATAPGLSTRLRDLATATAAAVETSGRPRPTASFGPNGVQPPGSRPGWLAEHGWSSRLTLEQITSIVTQWILREAAGVTPDA